MKRDLNTIGLTVSNHVSAMLAYWDKNQICRFANQAYVEWFGRTPEEMVGKITMKELLGTLYEKNLPYIQGVLKGEPQIFEREIPIPSGVTKHSQANYYPDKVNGTVEGFFVLVTDITTQKQIEHALQENGKRRQQILDSIPHLIWITDPQGKCTFLNKQWEVYTRMDVSDPERIDFMSLVHEEDRNNMLEQRTLSLEKSLLFQATLRFKTHSGEYRWMLSQTLPIYDEQGKLIERIGTATDIHEQKMALAAVEENEKRFRFMTNTVPQIIWTANPTGEVDYVNERWQKYTGKSLEETIGLQWSELLHPEDIQSTFIAWKESLETGNEFKVEQRLRNKQGVYRWFLSRAMPLKQANGEVSKWFGISTDIHDDKLYVQELREVQQEIELKNQQLSHQNVDLDNFVYNVSHDLRSPVASLQGLYGLLAGSLQDKLSPEEKELMQLMHTSLVRLNKTIGALGKIAHDQQEETQMLEQVYFHEMLAEVKEDIVSLSKEVQIQTEFKVPAVVFFRKHVRSILYNLLSNAIKYRHTTRAPLIQIRSRQEGDEICLSISDNGLGMHPEYIPKLFTPFKRLHTHIEGTGIGLYMIKRMIENHEGRISVESELGIGTTFYVFFKTKG
jgi:PAS domain S-box-containing protein